MPRMPVLLSPFVWSRRPSCLLSPLIAVRVRDQRLCNVLVTAAGDRPCRLYPRAVVDTAFLGRLDGVCQGAIFALALTVIVLRSPNAQVATHLSGMSQTIGYLIARTGPLRRTAARLTGGWTSTAYLFVALGAAAAFFRICGGPAIARSRGCHPPKTYS